MGAISPFFIMIRYLGSKYKLSDWIYDTISGHVGDLIDLSFVDLFAGTGRIGRTFKSKVKTVICNDLEYYSYVLNRCYIGNNKEICNTQYYIDMLNNEPLIDSGFIYKNFSAAGGRLYFTEYNAKKIDTIRTKIELLKPTISEELYFYLLTSLLESSDYVANTASQYGAFLKKLKTSAKKELILVGSEFELTPTQHNVYNENANDLIQKINGDILYLDPPYNNRQYSAYYHILNTIAQYIPYEPKGLTGKPPNYNKSLYCKKKNAKDEFDDLIKHADFKYIILSYNNEGLITPSEIKDIMSNYGSYTVESNLYRRFKSDSNANRNHLSEHTQEYLHILTK